MLMYLLSKFTGPRYRPEITWSYFWTHNIFRAYEIVFGRKFGIKAEMTSTAYRHKGKMYVTHKAWSFEAKVALTETVIRELLQSVSEWRMPRLVLVPMYSPMYQFSNSLKLPSGIPSPYRFAIAFDATSHSTSPGIGSGSSPFSWSHTCTGSNLTLVVGSLGETGISAGTYNSVSMTQQGTNQLDSAGNSASSMWTLFGPSTGANNITMTFTANSVYFVAGSYSGTNQSAVDSHTQNKTTVDATSYSLTTTVVASNCWLVAVASTENDTGCGTQSMTVGTSRSSSGNTRNNGSNQFGGSFGDSNATVSTGAQSLTFNATTSNHWTTHIVSLAPAGGGPTGNSYFFPFF